MNQQLQCETLIVGAGITGLAIARELLQRGTEDILVLEKEESLGAHASGRNSGVLHAGVYYHAGTLKARFCLEGNRLLKEYCRRKGLSLLETGKVIVARDESEIPGLMELKRRCEETGAEISMIDSSQLERIEPYARTTEVALHSPNTAVFQPQEVLESFREDLEESGAVQILFGVRFGGLEVERTAKTKVGAIQFEQLINAGGAHADRIAHEFGVGLEFRSLPFKGTYLRLRDGREHLVRGNIYPVPDLRNPFLGVHFTRSANGRVFVGPTAIPAFGRENYDLFDGLSAESAQILYRDAVMFLSNAGFRSAALHEPRMLFPRFVHLEAKKLVPELALDDLTRADKVGIRAQLVHWPRKELVKDFVILQKDRSLHILNAISPGFTSSMAFARHVVDQLENQERNPQHAL